MAPSLIIADRHGRPQPAPRPPDPNAGDLLVPFRARDRQIDPFVEQGTTGLRQFGGWVFEDILPQLQGRRGANAYREAMDNDPVIGAVLFAIRWMLRGVEWRVDEGSRGQADAEFLESCMHDMEHTWGDFVIDLSSFLGYGWSLHEQVFKRRQGPQPGPAWETNTGESTSEDDAWPASSRYTDGKVGWRKLPGRAQETLLHWHFAGYGDPTAMVQLDWHGSQHTIPLAKSLLFRTTTARNNPEGRSILRNAMTSYWAIKHVRALEGIGIERDLAGVPVATAPEGVDIWAPANSAQFQKMQIMVQQLRNDEYAGIVKNYGWELELMSSGGSRQFDVDKTIRRYRQDIALSMLADFVLLGNDGVGSFALAEVKSDMFGVALDGILDLICEELNRSAVPQLFALNGFRPADDDDLPKIMHGSAQKIDLDRVGTFLQAISLAGAPIPWSTEILESLFKDAGLPTNFDEHERADELPAAPKDPAADPANSLQGERVGAEVERAGLVQKAERPRGSRTVDVAPVMLADHARLTAQLEADLRPLLDQLGADAARAYAAVAEKAVSPAARRLAAKVIRAMNLPAWVARLREVVRNHAGRTMADTARTLQVQIGLEVAVADDAAERIAEQAGSQLGMRDIEPQVRAAIMQAIREGLASGDNPTATARRIRTLVPAGRFVHAGPAYRARLIASDQTRQLQRASALAAYQSNPHITHVELRDGIYGPPRSDGRCIDRDGDVVAIEDADGVHPYHVGCTLALLPVVSPTAAARVTELALA